MIIFDLKDEKVGFLSVINEPNVDVAKFNFGRGFFCQKPELGRLEDYSLYQIGEFSVDGVLVTNNEPIYLCNGLTAYNDFVNRINSLNLEQMRGVDENGDFDLEKENK